MSDEIQIEIYQSSRGRSPFLEWEAKLSAVIRAKVRARLARVRINDFGDFKRINGVKNIYELRIHLSPGYRIYYGKEEGRVVVLLTGGAKGSQKKDIERAQNYWKEYRGRK